LNWINTKVLAKETGLDELQQKISYPYDVTWNLFFKYHFCLCIIFLSYSSQILIKKLDDGEKKRRLIRKAQRLTSWRTIVGKVRDYKKKVKVDLWLEYFLHSGVMPHDLPKNVCIVSELCHLICQKMFLLYQSYAPWFAKKCLYCIRVMPFDFPKKFCIVSELCPLICRKMFVLYQGYIPWFPPPQKKNTMSCSISDLTNTNIFRQIMRHNSRM
jgi:ferredoxin